VRKPQNKENKTGKPQNKENHSGKALGAVTIHKDICDEEFYETFKKHISELTFARYYYENQQSGQSNARLVRFVSKESSYMQIKRDRQTWFLQSVPPTQLELEVIEDMNRREKLRHDSSCHELRQGDMSDDEACATVGEFSPVTGLFCTLSPLDGNDVGCPLHQDHSVFFIDDRDELKDLKLRRENLKKGQSVPPDKVMQHMTVQTWVLQNVEEGLANLVVTETSNSNATRLLDIELKGNMLHCQHCVNQKKLCHGVVPSKRAKMNSCLRGAKRLTVRSVSSKLGETPSDRFQKLVRCLCSVGAVCMDDPECDLKVSQKIVSKESHNVSNINFSSTSTEWIDDLESKKRKRNSDPDTVFMTAEQVKQLRLLKHRKLNKKMDDTSFQFLKNDMTRPSMNKMRKDDCHFDPPDGNDLNARVNTARKLWECGCCMETTQILRQLGVLLEIRHTIPDRKHVFNYSKFKKQVKLMMEHSGHRSSDVEDLTMNQMSEAIASHLNSIGKTLEKREDATIEQTKDEICEKNVICGPMLQPSGLPYKVGSTVDPGRVSNHCGLNNNSVSTEPWNSSEEDSCMTQCVRFSKLNRNPGLWKELLRILKGGITRLGSLS